MTASLMLRQLDHEWDRLAASRQLRRYLDHLNSLEPTWQLRTSDQLIALARNEPDHLPSLMTVLIDEATHDDLAFRIAIQVMLPRWWQIIDGLSGIPIDEAVALVVAIGSQHIRNCDPATAGTPIGLRLWCNTRREAIRVVVKMRTERARTASLAALPDPGAEDLYGQADQQLRDSIIHISEIDADAADLIVTTRVHGYRLADLAGIAGVSPATLCQRRRRAEQRLAAALAA